MEVVIKLWGNLSYYLPAWRGKFLIRKSLQEGQTVRDLVNELGLPKEMDIIIAVNETVAEGSEVLQDGDEVALFRPTSGGEECGRKGMFSS